MPAPQDPLIQLLKLALSDIAHGRTCSAASALADRPDWPSLVACPRVDPALLQVRADVITEEGRVSVAPFCAHDSRGEEVGGL